MERRINIAANTPWAARLAYSRAVAVGDGHLLFIEYIVAGRYHLAVVDGKTVGQRDDGPPADGRPRR